MPAWEMWLMGGAAMEPFILLTRSPPDVVRSPHAHTEVWPTAEWAAVKGMVRPLPQEQPRGGRA